MFIQAGAFMWQNMVFTVFRRNNAPDAEAENKPLTLYDFNESRSVDTRIPELHVLKI